jgi:hypothetical protein
MLLRTRTTHLMGFGGDKRVSAALESRKHCQSYGAAGIEAAGSEALAGHAR